MQRIAWHKKVDKTTITLISNQTAQSPREDIDLSGQVRSDNCT